MAQQRPRTLGTMNGKKVIILDEEPTPPPTPTPVRDIEKETIDAHSRLDMMIHQTDRWKVHPTMMDELVVNGETEYLMLMSVRSELYKNTQMFNQQLVSNVTKAVPKGKPKFSIFGSKK